VKLIIPLMLAAVAGAAAPTNDAPACVSALTLPDSALDLRLEYRQVSSDLALRRLQVATLLALNGHLDTDLYVRIGEHVLPPGRHPFGFTVGVGGGMRFFVVSGTEALPLAFQSIEPGWESPRLSLQLHYVDRGEALLVWHLGAHGGRATVHLGSDRAPEHAPDDEPGDR
jgi:hypothetical protein